jgi:hypothetical protein
MDGPVAQRLMFPLFEGSSWLIAVHTHNLDCASAAQGSRKSFCLGEER